MSDAVPRPAAFIERMAAYSVPRHPAPVDLRLDGNEGRPPDARLLARLAEQSTELLRRYPSARALEDLLARRFSVPASGVLVTAGADDGLDRACRAMLGPGRELVLPVPTFEMIDRYARAAGAEVRAIPWLEGSYPIDDVERAIGERTAAVAVVSPNNPTGAVAAASDLERASRAAPHAMVIFDHAYAEFADEDLTERALSLPNVVVFRTLSKAWGLAGLRVGYALGPPEMIGWLRRAGQPYAVSAPSLALAAMRLEEGREGIDAVVARVCEEREALFRELGALGHAPLSSQANFVLCAPRDPLWMRDALAGLGVGVRAWPGRADLERYVRISCPGEAGEFERLVRALRTASAPDAIVLRLEGVLVEERDGAGQEAAARGLLCERGWLEALARRVPIGLVTGLPRAEAERLLRGLGVLDLFRCIVGVEDAPAGGGEGAIAEAVRKLGARHAWAVGRTPEEMREARSAGALPLAIGEGGEDRDGAGQRLLAAGAARVLRRLESSGMLLP